MITKLKIQVDLSNIMEVNDNGKLYEEYRLYITVLDKDERFETTDVGDVLLHNGTDAFVIKSIWDEKRGGILHNGLLIPTNDKIGLMHKKTFKDDMDRYHFLKKLYVAIDEWANYWWGFKYDDKSYMVVEDNVWWVGCDTVYNGSMSYLRTMELEE